jgi:hypothetical protein
MINLLLPKEKQKIKKEYIFRFLIILNWILIICALVAIIMMIPNYILLDVEARIFKDEINNIQTDDLKQNQETVQNRIVDLQNKIEPIDPDLRRPSDFLRRIIEKQDRNISIQSISYSFIDEEIIVIQGNAGGRESLARFVDELKNIEDFSNVDLPYSSFAKDIDIPFSITIQIKNEESI